MSRHRTNSPPVKGEYPEGGRGLVPKLRFPEFRDAGEWEVKSLKSICFMQAGKFVSASGIFEHDKGDVYPCYGGNGLRGYTKTYTHSGKYPLIGRQGALCGNVNLVNGKFHATEHAVVVTPKEDINADWLFYTLDLLNLNRFATGQAQPGLSVEVLEKVSSTVPKKEKEQQKIADCLSSFDELITAEAQKLDTLKAHKKGLMQQLFPAEGETVPKLRFPEFRNAGVWEEKQLGDVSPSIFDGTHQTPTYVAEGIPFYSVENIASGNKNKFITREDYLLATSKNKPGFGDILITRIGRIGFSLVVDWNHEFSIYVTLAVIKKSKLFNSYYLNGYFQSERYQSEIMRKSLLNAVPCKINMDELRKTVVLFPSLSEQQKIASCLSSLDDLITAQTQKIEALKTHKKGLMQQLFPTLD
ncbi:MAG TPA: restriction endonuclease subunit S [Candidatus Competibacteraceae bacterium]|nr:restriction endonuclease subunit S [Candidatus Competibacteraceae bacterium]HPF59625.1 restriction endonuclease subunit S [Candidatus Competibacteraceae bacterium]